MEIIKVLPRNWALLLLLFIGGCAIVDKNVDTITLYGPLQPKQRQLTAIEAAQAQAHGKISYYRDIKPILNARCVACHGCYDSPCQLKLTAFEGLDRGASKQPVYDSTRLSPAEPTRLFTDAVDTAGWRKKHFFPVLNEGIDTSLANLDNSLLAKLIQLKRSHPLPESGKLDDSYTLELNRSESCPSRDEFDEFQRKHPHWGMPYAMPGLTLKQEYTLMLWLQQGAKVDPAPALSDSALQAIAKWEAWLNGGSLKQRLVSRYIYEHLFLGHLQFKGLAEDEFFRLLRSKTPPGQAIVEINTPRPYDDPGGPVYYRLQHYTATIVDKTHFVYQLSEQKRRRFEQLFLQPDYSVTALPSYDAQIAYNPFNAFQAIPRQSRYQFLLDDAEYFVSGFIKGPVCRGQIALNSIQDRFWVFFTNPDYQLQKQAGRFLAEHGNTLSLPGTDNIGWFGWMDFDTLGAEYLEAKERFIDQALPEGRGIGLDYIWDGDGGNENAALTVFRHFDSATVSKGFIGATPSTGWFVDYPIFERLHYLLVAGFNVYGTAGHQIASRTYMDILRQDAENNFLRLMPAAQRQKIYDSWYSGINGLRTVGPLFNVQRETEVIYRSNNFKQELFDQIRQKLGKAAGKRDTLNDCRQPVCATGKSENIRGQIEASIRTLAEMQGYDVAALPEVSLLRIETGVTEPDRVYTLLVDKALSNVSLMIAEQVRRRPEHDRLTIVPGFIGSYPNFFFHVKEAQLAEFIQRVAAARNNGQRELLYTKFGIRRSNPAIWRHLDWFNDQHKKQRGLRAGLLDMSRYHNY